MLRASLNETILSIPNTLVGLRPHLNFIYLFIYFIIYLFIIIILFIFWGGTCWCLVLKAIARFINISRSGRKEGNILFNDALNTFLFTVIWRQTCDKGPFR